MYFKQIEITGFKSFADQTQVRLEPGITAIVGPNGCGKSNILDAMRWALGEQSPKALRGSHMQDVIFNGSENRQATGMAEVTLTFDNADSQLPLDFAEVDVTRRVYRSGESEYLINKAPCRLRDVQELFMDTGIGTSAYSLIGQGKIDLILSSKPEDRRYVFEEAAGIIKYKSRKTAALRRLDGAAQNILRLNDIITEVQHQMRRLKRQANAAIRHREFTTTLRELEIRAAWLKHVQLTQDADQLKKQFATAQDSFEKASTETSALEARNEELGLARIDIERLLAEGREGVYAIDSEMEKVERTIALLRQQIEFSQEQQKQARQEHDDFKQRAHDISVQVVQTDEQAQELRREVDTRQAALEQEQHDHQHAGRQAAETDTHLEASRSSAVEAMNARAKTQTELETIDVGIGNIETQLEAAHQAHQDNERRNEEVLAQLEQAGKDRAQRQATLDALAADHQRLLEIKETKAQEMHSLNDQWQQLREKNGRDEARLRSLRELRDSYEGFASGVRAIMQAKQKQQAGIKGLIGPAGDLLSTDKAYERAVEAALGGNINNIVVKTADAAKTAIAFLKESKAGRVTFLPLDTIRPSQRDDIDSVRNEAGLIGKAIDQVQYDDTIHVAVQYLLHNTVIVETIDDAIRIARAHRAIPRLVTLDGEVVSSSGAVTGGRTRHESRGLLGRSAEITELEEAVQKCEALIADIGEKGRDLTAAIQDLTRQVEECQTQENTVRHELNEIGVLIARYTAEQENVSKTIRQATEHGGSLRARLDELAAQRTEALERLGTLETEHEARQQEIDQAQQAAAEARKNLAACADRLADTRVKLAEATQALDEVDRNRQREKREHDEALRQAEQRLETAGQHADNEARLEQQTSDKLQSGKDLSENKEEANKEVVKTQNQLQSILDELDTLAKTLRTARDQAGTSREALHQGEIALRHIEDQIEFFEERMLSEYHVALASLKAEEVGSDDHDDETREKMVADLRRKLERMGEVNMMAIEEYDELEKRNEFLVTQQQDLTQARDALLGVVARIDKTIRQMFTETFEQVSNYFRDYFRRLFNGGQARIYLLDEDDPLESGIEIEARPPGKKPQTIQLLSGGEQALTAISLLFSIFKAKPSPFCVLDEVDAPLDDANIGRFLDMVEEFIADSQFIVITHSKQTMAKADVLYGVTMQERGVSQLVSVKFDEAEDTGTAA